MNLFLQVVNLFKSFESNNKFQIAQLQNVENDSCINNDTSMTIENIENDILTEQIKEFINKFILFFRL